MSNSVIITNTSKEFPKLGLYLHWVDTAHHVKLFTDACKRRGVRNPNKDEEYSFAWMCVVAEELGYLECYDGGFGNDCVGGGIFPIVDKEDLKNLSTITSDNGRYEIDLEWNVKHYFGYDENEEGTVVT